MDHDTTRKRQTPEEVLRKLTPADRLLAEGKAMADWPGERVGLAFIPPGQPCRNGSSNPSSATSETNASTSTTSDHSPTHGVVINDCGTGYDHPLGFRVWKMGLQLGWQEGCGEGLG